MTWEEQIAAWSEKAGAFGVYDYFSLHEWDGSMPGKAKGGNVEYLRANIPHYHRLGATTLDGQSGCNWGPNGLGYYLTAQLTWDVEADVDAIVEDFYAAAFTGAAAPVRRFYERWQDSNEMSERMLVLAYRDLDAARRLAEGPGVEGRLDHLMMYLHWLRLRHEFSMARDPGVILPLGRELIRYSRRIMDTGLVHSQAIVLGWDFYKRVRGAHGFEKVTDLEGVTDGMVEGWKTERTDIPAHAEIGPALRGGAEDLRRPGSAGGAACAVVAGPRSGGEPPVRAAPAAAGRTRGIAAVFREGPSLLCRRGRRVAGAALRRLPGSHSRWSLEAQERGYRRSGGGRGRQGTAAGERPDPSADSPEGPLPARPRRRLQEGRAARIRPAAPGGGGVSGKRIRRLVHRDSAREPTALLLHSRRTQKCSC